MNTDNKEDLKLARLYWHLFGGSAVGFGYLFLPELLPELSKTICLSIMGAMTIFVVALDFLRLIIKPFNAQVHRDYARWIRPNERNNLSAMSSFAIASWLSIFLFPKMISVAAILFLTFGDAAARFFGIHCGKTELFKKKTLSGSSTCFIACCAVVAFIFLVSRDYSSKNLSVLFCGAVTATFTELLAIKFDNFLIPLASGGVMLLLATTL